MSDLPYLLALAAWLFTAPVLLMFAMHHWNHRPRPNLEDAGFGHEGMSAVTRVVMAGILAGLASVFTAGMTNFIFAPIVVLYAIAALVRRRSLKRTVLPAARVVTGRAPER